MSNEACNIDLRAVSFKPFEELSDVEKRATAIPGYYCGDSLTNEVRSLERCGALWYVALDMRVDIDEPRCNCKPTPVDNLGRTGEIDRADTSDALVAYANVRCEWWPAQTVYDLRR